MVEMDKDAIIRVGVDTTARIAPLNFAQMFKVMFPKPVIYTFDPGGDLICFVWARDFDRVHGRYSSNNLANIIKCDSILFEDQSENVQISQDHYLNINKKVLWQIMRYHAASNPDNSFTNDDLKLFFGNVPTSVLNECERWMENLFDELMRKRSDA
jgi:hypothetical protein